MAFGSGSTLSSARPIGSMRSAGMMLLGKHAGPPPFAAQFPVSRGSRMEINRLLLSRVCEKFPSRSSAVGILR
jgi:hypothetical protein